MATQFATTSNPVPAAAHRARKMMDPAPTLPIVRPKARREQKPIQTRESLVVDMLPLVKGVALKIRKRLPAHVELDDLISDGVLGLVDALAKFNPRKRVKLESYARHRIRGSILDGLRAADPVPRDIRRKHKSLEKHYQALEAKLGRSAKDEEMAAEVGMNLARWHRELNEIQSAGIDCGARVLSAAPICLPTSADPALLAGNDPNPFDICCRGEQREILSQALSELGERAGANHHPLLQMRTYDAGNRRSYERGRIASVAAPCGRRGPIESQGGLFTEPTPHPPRSVRPPLDGGGFGSLIRIILRAHAVDCLWVERPAEPSLMHD